MQTIYLDPKQVPAQLRGSYNGKKFKAIVCEQITIPGEAGLWSGGSRDSYYAISLDGDGNGKMVQASDNFSAPWSRDRQDRTHQMRPGMAIVKHTIFQGQDLGLTYYVHPDSAAKLLPAPSAELSDHEQIVLNATCGYKSSYNGKDRYELARPYSPTEPYPTRDEWNVAKASLISKGLLNKAGAVTVAGRNARTNQFKD